MTENGDLEKPEGNKPEAQGLALGPGLAWGFFLGLLILGALLLASKHLGRLPFVADVLVVIVASIPIYISLAYDDSVRDALVFQNLSPGGLIRRLFGRRLLSNLLSAIIAMVLACGLVLNLATLGPAEWPFVFLMLPLQLALFWFFHRITRNELDASHLSPYFSSRAAGWLAPLITLLAYSLGMAQLAEAFPRHGLLAAVLSQPELFPGTRSSLLAAMGEWYRLIGGGRDFALGLAHPFGFWAWFMLNLIFSGTLFFGVAAILRLVTIPKGDIPRIAARTSMKAGKAGAFAFFMAVALPALLIAYLFFATSLRLELMAQGEPGRELDRARQSFDKMLVMIDGEYYEPGILHALSEENKRLGPLIDSAKAELRAAVNGIFSGYEANVDGYLDWYYSLPAEYARLLTMVLGEVEEYMAFNMEKRLGEGVDAQGITTALARLYAISQSVDINGLKERYRYRGPVNTKPMLVIDSKKINPLGDAPFFVPFQQRRIVSGISGLTAGLVARYQVKKLVEKIARKLFFKTASKALVKMAVSKTGTYAASAATGSMGGAVVGSIFPGIGTGIGAVIGGIVGVGTAFVADKLLLSLEESINRREFKESIVSSIEEDRMEALKVIDDF
ncbi:MAG: hypothetical protein LBF40_06910 [Deltaproteobacteria bacterium]|nr:hypothetical protein [Deltaproteobacteria bacterium]